MRNKIKLGIFTTIFLIRHFFWHDTPLFSKSFFRFQNHVMKLKAHNKSKMQAKKVFWHVILHSYLCNVLCKLFIKIESNCFSKTYREMEGFYDQSKEARKKNVLHVTTKNYLGNILCKFLIKFESTWRCEIKEHTPLLTLDTLDTLG